MVLSTAALKSLRRIYPQAKITVVASENNNQIIVNNPNVDTILIHRGFLWFLKEMRKRAFDLAVDPFNTYELKPAFLAFISGARYRVGFEEAGREIFFNVKGPSLHPVKHLIEHLHELIGCLGVAVNGCEPELFVTDEEINWAIETLSGLRINRSKPTVAIHPGGYYESQRWPAEKYGLVARELLEEFGVNVLVFCGPREKHLARKILDISGDNAVAVSDVSVRQLMAIMSRCKLFLGNNSGPLHVSAALGIPTVSLIGPTIVPLWLPWGRGHIVLRKKELSNSGSGVIANQRGCLESITVDEVLEAVGSQIKELKTVSTRP
jgi:ADP-heptose:LPS heptosyltransferase